MVFTFYLILLKLNDYNSFLNKKIILKKLLKSFYFEV